MNTNTVSRLSPTQTTRRCRAKKFLTIGATSTAIIRRNVHAGYRVNVGAGTIFEIGRATVEASTGRIRCRHCAQNIAKGVQIIRFAANLNVESDSYFLSECALHYDACPKIQEGGQC
ncbi:MAG TPA: hypothetical protein VGB77_15740 [Abditibacteriaceae bacterium]|jgi:hypothetical protein